MRYPQINYLITNFNPQISVKMQQNIGWEGWELLFKNWLFTGEPYGVHSSMSSVFSFQKTIPVINIKHKDKDNAMVNQGLFPIAKLNLKENFKIKGH